MDTSTVTPPTLGKSFRWPIQPTIPHSRVSNGVNREVILARSALTDRNEKREDVRALGHGAVAGEAVGGPEVLLPYQRAALWIDQGAVCDG